MSNIPLLKCQMSQMFSPPDPDASSVLLVSGLGLFWAKIWFRGPIIWHKSVFEHRSYLANAIIPLFLKPFSEQEAIRSKKRSEERNCFLLEKTLGFCSKDKIDLPTDWFSLSSRVLVFVPKSRLYILLVSAAWRSIPWACLAAAWTILTNFFARWTAFLCHCLFLRPEIAFFLQNIFRFISIVRLDRCSILHSSRKLIHPSYPILPTYSTMVLHPSLTCYCFQNMFLAYFCFQNMFLTYFCSTFLLLFLFSPNPGSSLPASCSLATELSFCI